MSTKTTARAGSVAVLALLIFAALGPGKWVPRSGLGWQFDHIAGYVAFTWIFCLAWRQRFVVGPALMFLAVLLEGLQAFTPDRHADLQAASYNAGAVLGATFLAELFVRARTVWSGWTLIAEPFRLLQPALNNPRMALLMAQAHLLRDAVARRVVPQSPVPAALIAQPIQVRVRAGSWIASRRIFDQNGTSN